MELPQINSVIEAAGFDEHDLDLGTSGLCGTFALSLKSVLPDVRLAFLCPADSCGAPMKAKDGGIAWRHAVVEKDGVLFDIEGAVKFQDIVENYCWGSPGSSGGVLVYLDDPEFVSVLKSDRKSHDDRHLKRWAKALEASMDRLSASGLEATTARL